MLYLTRSIFRQGGHKKPLVPAADSLAETIVKQFRS